LNQLFGADGVELVLNGRRAFRDYRLRTQRYAVLVAPQALREDRRLRPGPDPTARPRSPFHTAAMPTWPPANGRGRADPLKTGDNQAHQKNDQNCEAQPK
jgi:hypothetical protein